MRQRRRRAGDDHPCDARHHGRDQRDPHRQGRPRGPRHHRGLRADAADRPLLRAGHPRRLDHLAQARAAGAAGADRGGPRAHQRPGRGRPRAEGGRSAREARPPQGAGHRGADRLPDERLCRRRARGADPRDRARGDARRPGLDLVRGPAGDVRVRARDHHGRQLLRGAGGPGLCEQPGAGAEAAQDRRLSAHPALRRRARLGRGEPQLAGERADERPRRRRRRRALDRAAGRLPEPAHAGHGRHVHRRGADPRRRAAQAARDHGGRRHRARALARRAHRGRGRRLHRPRARDHQGAARRAAERRAPTPALRPTARAATSRPSPMPTSCSATCRAT